MMSSLNLHLGRQQTKRAQGAEVLLYQWLGLFSITSALCLSVCNPSLGQILTTLKLLEFPSVLLQAFWVNVPPKRPFCNQP